MLTLRHFAALLLLVNAVVLSTQGAQAQPRATGARSSVDVWLSLVDRARAEDSWRQASAAFKVATTQQRWSATLAHVRRTLRPIAYLQGSRVGFCSLSSIRHSRTAPA